MIIPIPLLLYLIDDAPEDNADGNGGKPPYPDRAPSNDKNHRINGQSQDHPCRVEAKGLSETMRRGRMRISVPGGSLRRVGLLIVGRSRIRRSVLLIHGTLRRICLRRILERVCRASGLLLRWRRLSSRCRTATGAES